MSKGGPVPFTHDAGRVAARQDGPLDKGWYT